MPATHVAGMIGTRRGCWAIRRVSGRQPTRDRLIRNTFGITMSTIGSRHGCFSVSTRILLHHNAGSNETTSRARIPDGPASQRRPQGPTAHGQGSTGVFRRGPTAITNRQPGPAPCLVGQSWKRCLSNRSYQAGSVAKPAVRQSTSAAVHTRYVDRPRVRVRSRGFRCDDDHRV